MKTTSALMATIMSLILTAVLITGCTEGNVVGSVVQEEDSRLGSGPDVQAANQSAVSVNIDDSAGDSESGQCFVDGKSLAEIFAGRGSL